MTRAALPELAVFDLDHTLLAGDSDYLWGQFLIDTGHVDRARHEAANEGFYADYTAGTLDIEAFCRFALGPLTRLEPATLASLQRQFVAERIQPIIAPGAPALLAQHRAAGHHLLISTSTNRVVTQGIAALLGVADLLATEAECSNGRYTGRVAGVPNFQAGKVVRLRQWMAHQTHAAQGFGALHVYSDSRNDLPLLEAADHPVAVDPDDKLRAVAQQRGWPTISLRGSS